MFRYIKIELILISYNRVMMHVNDRVYNNIADKVLISNTCVCTHIQIYKGTSYNLMNKSSLLKKKTKQKNLPIKKQKSLIIPKKKKKGAQKHKNNFVTITNSTIQYTIQYLNVSCYVLAHSYFRATCFSVTIPLRIHLHEQYIYIKKCYGIMYIWKYKYSINCKSQNKNMF